MHDYEITDQSGQTVVIRALTKPVAVRLYCELQGCTKVYVKNNCVIKRI